MIISLRDLSYSDLKKKLTPEDRIVLYSCNSCVVACGIGGYNKMDELEKALSDDGYQVIGKDLISIGCTHDLVQKRRVDETKKRMYEQATVIIPLVCEDGFELVEEVFNDKKNIRTAKTVGVGNFSPGRGVLLTTPFESTGLDRNAEGYGINEVAVKLGLYPDFFEENEKSNDSSNLISITIDGKKVIAHRNQNLLELCEENGIDIPHLCYHADLSDYGACRLCLVKIEGMRELAASCCVKVEDGMNIITRDAELEKYRKTILELIIASGNHNCLTCTKGVPTAFSSCELQAIVRKYDIEESRFKTLYDKKEDDDSSPVIYLDLNKCILCGRCVRACEELAGLSNLGFINRGEKTIVAAGLNLKMNQSQCAECMACAHVCPTGALNEKIVYFSGDDWKPVRIMPY